MLFALASTAISGAAASSTESGNAFGKGAISASAGGLDSVWAEDGVTDGPGTGDGGGSGEGWKIAFTLDESDPQDGDKDVPVDVQIFLLFNKNICNVAILDNNRKCFHLTSESGEVVPVKITVPDDQVQQDHKREVVIKPKKKLKKNTTYRVSVDSTLMAKNGTNIDDAKQITFTTGEKTGAKKPEILSILGENVQTFDSALEETEASIPGSSSSNASSDSSKSNIENVTVLGMPLKLFAFLTALVIFIIIVLVVIRLIRRKRRRTA